MERFLSFDQNCWLEGEKHWNTVLKSNNFTFYQRFLGPSYKKIKHLNWKYIPHPLQRDLQWFLHPLCQPHRIDSCHNSILGMVILTFVATCVFVVRSLHLTCCHPSPTSGRTGSSKLLKSNPWMQSGWAFWIGLPWGWCFLGSYLSELV